MARGAAGPPEGAATTAGGLITVMSSFYDRTGQLARWCAETGLEPKEAIEILRQRLLQAKAYWLIVAKKIKTPEAGQNPQTFQTGEGDLQIELWNDFKEFAEFLRLETTQPFFDLVEEVYRTVSGMGVDGELLYRRWLDKFGKMWDVLHKPFEVLHEAGHRLARSTGGRYSDNPYGRQWNVPDSDEWVRRHHPEAMKR